MIEKLDLEPGTWVQVWAQVADVANHPEDTALKMESHSDHYIGHVRNDRIIVPTAPPSFAPRCVSLYQHVDDGPLWRCESFDDHPGKHHAKTSFGTVDWDEGRSAGYFEEK